MKTAAGVTYAYDGLGNRVSKSNGKLYWYGMGSSVLDESDLSGNITNEYVYFGGQRAARRDASGNVYYYVEDMLGTSRVLTTSNGTVCYDADFYPFGGERTPLVNTCPQNFKFNGKERDPETGLDDFGARYFSSSFGRWLSPDWSAIPAPVPYADLTNPQTLNLYQFVGNNPESFSDAMGHAIMAMSGTPPPRCALYGCEESEMLYGDRGTAGNGIATPTVAALAIFRDSTPASQSSGGWINGVYYPPQGQKPALVSLPDGLKYTVATPGPNSPEVHVLFAPEVATRLADAIRELNKEGIVPQINSAFRTNEEQAYMRAGGSGSNPAAKVSWHQAGAAVDINGTRSPQFKTIIAVMEKHGFVWGGNFKPKADAPHFDGRKFMGNLNQAVRKAQSYWDQNQ
jgi:RHS repeat-associated protein